MSRFDRDRRSLLFTVGALGVGGMLPQGVVEGQGAAPQGYVFGATEGEHLVHFRDQWYRIRSK